MRIAPFMCVLFKRHRWTRRSVGFLFAECCPEHGCGRIVHFLPGEIYGRDSYRSLEERFSLPYGRLCPCQPGETP